MSRTDQQTALQSFVTLQSCLGTIGDTRTALQQTLQRGLRRMVEAVVLPRIKAAVDALPLTQFHFTEVCSLA